jgi:tRNA A-37 threonylcarbamoyl transferase component Bud32
MDLSLRKEKTETLSFSAKTKNLISKILKKELSLNFTKFISPYLIKPKEKEYFEEYLKEIAKELISRSHKKKGISKYIFSKYFELPGLISRRLFIVFNNNEDEEYLCQENFVENMLNLFMGDFNKLSNMIFKLFDFNNNGFISYDEIRMILSYIPISHKNYDNKKFRFEQNEFIDRIESQEEIALSLKIIFCNKKSISYKEFVNLIKYKNSDIFIFLLIFILERKPFIKEIIELYKEDNCCEESEENEDNEEDDKNSKKIIYIVPPIIGIDKEKSTPNEKKKFLLTSDKTTLNNPILTAQKYQTTNLLAINENEGKKEKNKLHHSKSDENIKNINEKHKEDTSTKVTYSKDNALSEINFIKLRPSEARRFPIKRRSKCLINLIEGPKSKIITTKSVWQLNNFKLNKNFGLNKIEDFEESEGSDSLSSYLDSDEEENSENSKDKKDNNIELSDEQRNNNNISNKKKIIKEGYLYRISESGKLKKIYFKLINNHLFYFKNKDSAHIGMNCLIRAFIKESYAREINDKDYFCFKLIFGKKEREYFVDNEEEYSLWLNIFKKILHCENINDLYNIQNKIGQGKYAPVYKGMHKTKERIVAIKILEKENISANEINMIKNEIDILKICQHPNIVKLYDVIEDSEKIHIIMELIEGPDLFSYLEKKNFDINESEASKIIYELSSALFYLNVFGIIHRDIKPENILLTKNSSNYDIKIIDFGLGIILGPEEKSEQPFGTISFVAPEVLLGNGYDKSVDIWCVGVLAYLLLVGRLPFDHPDDDENEIARQTINDPVPFVEEKWKNISDEAKSFVNKCLQKDPADRIKITELLEHDWIKKYISKEQKDKKSIETLSSHEVLKILCHDCTECNK